MGVSVATPATTALLSTIARIKAEIGITTTPTNVAQDDLFEQFIRQAGPMAETYCGRIFPRQSYTELARAYGGPYLTTRQAPVVALASVVKDGDTVTDVTIEDSAAGFLYRQAGFDWTAQRYARVGLGNGLFLNRGIPVPLSEEPAYTLTYTAGFLLPPQNILATGTVSASSTDDSFNDTASGFPSLLKAGDIVETSKFTNAANNGRFLVTGTPTTAKFIVSASLTTESAASSRRLLFSTLPGDIERAVIEIVKSLYAKRATDSSIVEKSAGPMRLRYREGADSSAPGLPPSAAALLRPWVRRAA